MNFDPPPPEFATALERLQFSIAQVLGEETVQSALAAGNASEPSEERTMGRLLRRELWRQANIERIIRLAAQDLGFSNDESLMDRSWLAYFFNHAQDAGNEEEQLMWARILGQEMINAGSFGKRTLAFLSAMEPWELDGFVEYSAFAFAFESGGRFMFDGESARREIWTYGHELDLTRHFIDIGLLLEQSAHINPGSAKGLRIRYGDLMYELRCGTAGGRDNSGIAYRKFTVVGQQLFDAIRPKVFLGYARNVINALNAECGMHFELLEPSREKIHAGGPGQGSRD